tara:strand:- start:51 stop:809 length:759 start_codon:yes stop_codon:yes gene_type:complete
MAIVVKKPKVDLWSALSEKLGDFVEKKLWHKDPKAFFEKRYEKEGKEYAHQKMEENREQVRSLYGLIPQTSGQGKRDAVLYAIGLLVSKPLPGFKTFLRGITGDKGSLKKMIKVVEGEKRIMGGASYKGGLHTSESPLIASGYMESKQSGKIAEDAIAGIHQDLKKLDRFMNNPPKSGLMLEFRVPTSFVEKEVGSGALGGTMWEQYGRIGRGQLIPGAREVEFKKGLLRDWLHKIHKPGDINRNTLPWLLK